MKKRTKFITAIATSLLLFGSMIGCGPTDTSVAVSSVTLNKNTYTMNVGDTFQLEATVSPTNATNKKVTWTVSNTNATVSSSGLVTAKHSGTVRVTATSHNNKTASCNFTIYGDNAVLVRNKNGVTATVDKERAFKGDEVTVTVTEVKEGFVLNKVLMNGTELSESSANVYKFTMPNNSAEITFDVSVTGEMVIEGDFSAIFTETSTTGLYKAANVEVSSASKATALFDVKVNGELTTATDLDETKSFADVTTTFSKTNNIFQIATGCIYDFYYDLNATYPFYVQRVGVTETGLPSDPDSLATMLIAGGKAIRSESAMYSGVTSIHYDVYNIDGKQSTDKIEQVYDWKKYADNTTFAYIEDKNGREINQQYVYKKLEMDFDQTTGELNDGVLTVVDTYPLKKGTLINNDDPYREDYNEYGAYSARYSILDESDDDMYGARFAMNPRTAKRTLDVSSHMPVYYVEREIMDSYRVGYGEYSDMKYESRVIVSERDADIGDGSFITTITTTVEYTAQSSSGSDASYANTFRATLKFDKRGALTGIDYSKRLFTISQWDFASHKAKQGQSGTEVKGILATYGYATPVTNFDAAATKSSTGFDLSDYFVNSITGVRVYNSACGKAEDDQSHVRLSDDIYLYTPDGKKNPNLKVFTFEPATALDLWQYGPSASSDENVISKEPNDLFYTMSATNSGTSTVTFSNHNVGMAAGATFATDIEVATTDKIRGFYLYDADVTSYSSITEATPVNVKAGTIHNYEVVQYLSSAPRVYTAVSSDTSIVSVTSAPNSAIMTLDFTNAEVSKVTKVTITMTSDLYDPTFRPVDPDTKEMIPIIFTFFVMPKDIDPTGTWGMYGYENDVQVVFTGEKIAGTDKYKGTFIDNGNGTAGNSWFEGEFSYTFDGLTLECKVTKITWHNSSDWSTDPNDYQLICEYNAEAQPEGPDGPTVPAYGIGLAEVVVDEYYESVVSYDLWGETDGYGEWLGLTPFVLVEE